MVKIFVLKVAEFIPMVEHAKCMDHVAIDESTHEDYVVLSSDLDITLNRKAMKFHPALWYSQFVGGIQGEIKDYTRDEVTITSAGE
jgi:hypothetical protein